MDEAKQAKLTKRVARLVAVYIEHVWAHLERTGGTPDEPMQTAKGSTNPPFGDYAHRLLDANRVASDYFYAALEETSKCRSNPNSVCLFAKCSWTSAMTPA